MGEGERVRGRGRGEEGLREGEVQRGKNIILSYLNACLVRYCMYTEGTKEESTLRNVILPSVVVSVAIVSCLIASVASVIITVCCMQAISSKKQLPNK